MLTYGTEFGIKGAHEPENRASINWSEDPKWLPLISDLSALRSKHPVLKDGTAQIIHLEEDVLLYGQRLGSSLAIVGINHSDQTFSLSYTNPDASYHIENKRLQSGASLELQPEEVSVWIWNESPVAEPSLQTFTVRVQNPLQRSPVPHRIFVDNRRVGSQ